jgi:soluble lytic murein transglycosylase-like protein
MQINSSNLRRLGTFGITERQLFDACTNIHVGAWISPTRFNAKVSRGGGAYNAACTKLKGSDCAAARSKFAWCVYRHLPTPSTLGSVSSRPPSLTSLAPAMSIIATRVGP